MFSTIMRRKRVVKLSSCSKCRTAPEFKSSKQSSILSIIQSPEQIYITCPNCYRGIVVNTSDHNKARRIWNRYNFRWDN